MERFKKLIFVDSDDTCRAAMIKILMSRKVLASPLEIESRGLVVLFPEPLDAKASAVLEAHGYGDCSYHQAVQLKQEDIADNVLLLTMEDRQKIKIWEEFENARNVYTLAEFMHYTGDILPLYGEPLKSFEEWVNRMEKLLDQLAKRLDERDSHARTAEAVQQMKKMQEQADTAELFEEQKEETLDRQENGLSDMG